MLGRRPQVDRVCYIDQRLRSGSYPNAEMMGARLGVTPRTILRDIEFMKKKRHMPIAFDPRRNGFYYTKPVEALTPPQLSEEGILAILMAYKALAQYRAAPFEKPLDEAFRQLVSQFDNRELDAIMSLGEAVSFRPFAPEHTDPELLATLKEALAARRELRFCYRNAGQTRVIPRCIQPYHLFCFDQRWYLIGFDVHQRAMRTYAASRITKPRLQTRSFVWPSGFNPDDYFQGTLGVMKGDTSVLHEVVIELDSFGTDLIGGRRLHPSQELTPLGGNRSRLTLRLSSLDELEREILSWGTHATVIGPDCLRQRLAAAGAALVKTYGAAAAANGDGGHRPRNHRKSNRASR